jgi:apolipoprotein N-acyltransferase
VRLTHDLPALPEPVAAPARRAPRLGGLATAAAAAVLFVVVAAGLPADVWAPLLTLGLPVLLMLLFTLAPLALPILGFVWVARIMAGPRRVEHRALPRRGWH